MPIQKKLYLVRHAKSSWGYENISDMDRPLKNRGINNSYEMAKKLKERGAVVDMLISSPAIRALHTAVIFSKEVGNSFDDIKINDVVYFSDEKGILDLIRKMTDAIDNLMIFGHNPVISDLANIFLRDKVDYIPTAGIVELIFDVNTWMKIDKSNLVAEWFDTPKKTEID